MALHVVSGGTLAVERVGRGAPLVLLHGFTGRASELLEAAGPLGAQRELLAVELPGHGRSDWGTRFEAHHFERVVEGLEQLFDALGLERFDLWGYSMGGRLALALALAHPARIRSLILESTSAGLRPEESREERWSRDRGLAAVLVEQGPEAFVAAWEAQPLFATERELPEPERARIRATRLSHEPHRLAAALLGMSPANQTPLWDRLSALSVPTLVITGARDTKYERLARLLAEKLPRAQHTSIPGAGHAPHRERPDLTLEAVRAFLAAGEPG